MNETEKCISFNINVVSFDRIYSNRCLGYLYHSFCRIGYLHLPASELSHGLVGVRTSWGTRCKSYKMSPLPLRQLDSLDNPFLDNSLEDDI